MRYQTVTVIVVSYKIPCYADITTIVGLDMREQKEETEEGVNMIKKS